MKRKVFVTIFAALILALSVGLTACGNTQVTPPEPAPEPSISLDVTDARLDVYESLRLTATTANTDAAVEWSSSDSSIATVDGGLVVACAEGTATVTAKAGDVSATCTVSVYNSWTSPVLVVDHDRISIAKGGSYTVTATTKWKGNDITDGVEYSWSLGEGENGDIVGLSATGNKATFTGKEYGAAEFVVFATVNGVPLVRTVAVKVCNADIVFGVSNLERGVGGYAARLALLKLDDTIVDIIPDITVSDADGVVDGATARMEWRIEGDAQAVSRDESTGKISAVAEGNAQVIGSYENAELVINVTVYRPQIYLNDTVYFETSKLLPKTKGVVDPAKPAESGITIEGLQGEVTSAKLGSADIFSLYDANENLLVINKNNLNTDRSILGETQALRVDTDKAIYDISAKVVTLAIRTPADLDSIATVSADESKYWAPKTDSTTEYLPYYWDGYYVLANDIDYVGDRDGHEFVTFIDWSSLEKVKNPDHLDADWMDGRYFGFRGTFDGQGYNIDNFKLKNVDTGGIFGVMATDGVFRNVSFTNAVNPGGTGLICSAGDGTIENVYIQCSAQTGGWSDNRSGMFYTRDIINTAAVKNVFVDTRLTYNDSNTAGEGWIYAFGYAYPRSANYRGVYCVGTERAYAEKYQGGTGVDNIYGAYNTYTDLRNSGVKFDEWSGDFWKIVNGFPFPKKLDIPTVDTDKCDIVKSMGADGETVTITVDKYAVVTLDAASVLAGVRLVGVEQNDSAIQKLVFEPVAEDKTVTLTVKSAYDAVGAGKQYTVDLKSNVFTPLEDPYIENFEGGGRTYVEKNNAANATVSVADGEGVGNSKALKIQSGASDVDPRPLLVLDEDMKETLQSANKFSLKVRVERGNLPEGATFNLRFGNYEQGAGDHNFGGYASSGNESGITLDKWYEITYTDAQLTVLKETGILWMWIQAENHEGRYDFIFYVDDLAITAPDPDFTISAENKDNVEFVADSAVEIASFTGEFEPANLGVTLNGSPYTDYTLDGKTLSFVPTGAGEYNFVYTYTNGHFVNTATQKITVVPASLADPYFDGFEGKGNGSVMRAVNGAKTGLSKDVKYSGNQALRIDITAGYESIVYKLDTDMLANMENTNSSKLSLRIYIAEGSCGGIIVTAYNKDDGWFLNNSCRVQVNETIENGKWYSLTFSEEHMATIKSIGALTICFDGTDKSGTVAYVDDIEAQRPLADPTFDGFEGLGNSYAYKTGTVSGEIASWELSQEEKRSGNQSLKLNIPKASSIVLKIDTDMINAIGADSQLSFWLKAPNADSITIGIYKGGDNWNLGGNDDRITSSETDANGWQKFVFSKETTQKIKSSEEADNSITLYFEFNSAPGVAYVDDLQLIEAE